MEMTITWSDDHEQHEATEAHWDWYEIKYRINPDRKPTEAELRACPKVFTCFSCLEKFSIRELGGVYHEKRFCSSCIPYIDEWTAGAMLWWTMKRKRKSLGKAKPANPNAKLERVQSIVNAVEWAKKNGYPIQ